METKNHKIGISYTANESTLNDSNIANTQTHHTENDRAAYKSLNNPKFATNRDRSSMLSKNPITTSIVQILHKSHDWQPSQFISPYSGIREASNTIADKIDIYQQIQQQLPDLKAAKRIRTSMILSPHDLMTISLNYSCNDTYLPPSLVRSLLENVKSVFDTSEYDIKHYLKKITDDITVDTGSYALAVIPEPTINDVINAPNLLAIEKAITKEILNLTKATNKNIVFATAKETVDHIKCDDNKNIFNRKSDNVKRSDILNYTIIEGIEGIQISALKRYRNEIRMAKTYYLNYDNIDGINEVIHVDNVYSGNEDINQAEINHFKNEIFHNKPNVIHNTIKMNHTDWLKRPAVGHPMTFHYPSECVIPIHIPGDPTQHIGFLVLTNSDNNPITSVKNSPNFDAFNDGRGSASMTGTTYNEVISSISRYQNGTNFDYRNTFLPNELLNVARRIIEDDVTERLYNGTYSSSSQSVSCPENVALIMLSYRLADMQVNLQFIPANLMTYFALDYDDLGVGRSSLDDIMLIASLRSAIQMADTMAGIKNSIGNTRLKINIDPLDKNVQQTIESLIQRVATVRSMTPILYNNPPSTIAQFMASAFMQTEISLDNSAGDDINPIPETRVEITEDVPNYPGPSEELKEDLRNKSLLGIGVPKELVDAASSIDFATSIIYSNLMLNKQTLEDQLILNTHITNHVRQFTMNSGKLMNMFVRTIKSSMDVVKEHLKGKGTYTVKDLIDEFVNHLEVKLPEPNNTRYEAQLASLNAYIGLVDSAIEICIKDGIIGKIISEVSNTDTNDAKGFDEDRLTSIIKMELVRKFMQSNGILPDLFNLFDTNSDITNIIDSINSMDGEIDIAIKAYNNIKETIVQKIAVIEGLNKAIDSSNDGYNNNNGDNDNSDALPPNEYDFGFNDGENKNSDENKTQTNNEEVIKENVDENVSEDKNNANTNDNKDTPKSEKGDEPEYIE